MAFVETGRCHCRQRKCVQTKGADALFAPNHHLSFSVKNPAIARRLACEGVEIISPCALACTNIFPASIRNAAPADGTAGVGRRKRGGVRSIPERAVLTRTRNHIFFLACQPQLFSHRAKLFDGATCRACGWTAFSSPAIPYSGFSPSACRCRARPALALLERPPQRSTGYVGGSLRNMNPQNALYVPEFFRPLA